MATVRRAFTLLEMLIVIVVILILASLLIVGINRVLKSSKEQATKILLGNLQGMLAELDAKTKLSNPTDPGTLTGQSPRFWVWFKDSTTTDALLPCDPNTTTPVSAGPPSPPTNLGTKSSDFWKVPATWATGVRTYDAQYDAMDAPGLVTSSDSVTRNGCRAVLNTQFVMRALLSVPANRSSLEKTSADRLFVPDATGGTLVRSPGADGCLYTADDSSTTLEQVYYLPNAQCKHLGAKYICSIGHFAAPPSQTPGTPPDANWAPDPTPSTPLLLDSWGNPMIFVPATGLRVRLLNGTKDYTTFDGNAPYDTTNVYTTIIISPEGQVGPDPGDATKTIVIKPGRPFFASAGPDGDFAKGDDNVYSFQP